MRRKSLYEKETRDSDNFISKALVFFTKGDNLMTNYKRQARVRYYKNRLQSLKQKIINRTPLFETQEVHIASVMPKRQLPEVCN